MADLADIAAAAGISIIDTALLNDGGDMDHAGDSNTKISNVTSTLIPDGSGDTAVIFELDSLGTLFRHRYTEEDPDYAKTVADSEVNSHPPCVEGFFGKRQRDRSWRRDKYHGDQRGHRGRGDYHYHGNRNQYHRGRDRSNDNYHRDRSNDNYHRDRSYDNYHRDRSYDNYHRDRSYSDYRDRSSR